MFSVCWSASFTSWISLTLKKKYKKCFISHYSQCLKGNQTTQLRASYSRINSQSSWNQLVIKILGIKSIEKWSTLTITKDVQISKGCHFQKHENGKAYSVFSQKRSTKRIHSTKITKHKVHIPTNFLIERHQENVLAHNV